MPTTSLTSSKEGLSIAPSPTTENLPLELVQLILEAFVADIVENSRPIPFQVQNQPNDETGSKFSVQVAYDRKEDPAGRWREIQVPLHINKHTRALTQKHFFSYPLWWSSGEIQGWICPRWDLFSFYICQAEKGFLEIENNGLYLEKHPDRGLISQLQQAIEDPAPFDVQLVRGMQIVHPYPVDLFSSNFCKGDVELAFSLPNLREIHIREGTRLPCKAKRPHFHGGLQRIDAARNPELAACGYDDGEVFDICAREAQKRGVRIVCVAKAAKGYQETAELFRTPEGTRMKFDPVEAGCY